MSENLSDTAVVSQKKGFINSLFISETNNTFIQFFRSLFVGGIATVADMGFLILFRELFKMPETGATVIGFVAGLTVNYIISTFWVFSKAKVQNRVFDFIAFAVIGIIGLGLTSLIIAPFAMEGLFGEGFFVRNQIFPKSFFLVSIKDFLLYIIFLSLSIKRLMYLSRKPEMKS